MALCQQVLFICRMRPVPQIFLFSGENRFAIGEECSRWIRHFREKHGEENLLRIEAKGLTTLDILREVAVAPFIAQSRLVVVDGPLRWLKADVEQLREQIHPQVVLLTVVHLESDKYGKLPATMKEYAKVAEQKTFPLLRRTELLQWVAACAQEHGVSITNAARDCLLEMVGEDQGMLRQEIIKLSLFAAGKPIERDHVLAAGVCAGEREIWPLMDVLGTGDVRSALRYLESALERGSSPSGIWTQFLWMVSQLVLVWSALEDGVSHPTAIVKHVGVRPSAARALLPFARTIKRHDLLRITDRVARTDRDLKTGVLRATGEAPEELTVALEACILSFAA
ncbi:DNA polymerase III subunit delta [Candidatus Peregrinibacteria bacterium CG10_big_fil_rev_8_21_14_0_10_55_24]|nr:MAG: DNA polymerase III subunit delta [Candidatus Peregrinibacteria bacterium CG10_big_fil_rev_8_21_14_0_10_55_24]